jgi:hypothetical protein
VDTLFKPEDIIYSYTRAQAIEDGEQMPLEGELATMARELYKYPVYLTRSVVSLVERAVAHPKWCNDWAGVVWDILWMSRHGKSVAGDTQRFKVTITGTGRRRLYDMLIQCGPTDIDDPSPALTVMLPEEH